MTRSLFNKTLTGQTQENNLFWWWGKVLQENGKQLEDGESTEPKRETEREEKDLFNAGCAKPCLEDTSVPLFSKRLSYAGRAPRRWRCSHTRNKIKNYPSLHRAYIQ